MSPRSLQDLLAERRENALEMHRSDDAMTRAMLAGHIAVLDLEIGAATKTPTIELTHCSVCGAGPLHATECDDLDRCAGCAKLAHVRVLIVEDDLMISRGHERTLRRTLANSEIAVVAVTTAEDAIGMLADETFDLIISDYNLAGARKGGDVFTSSADGIPFLFVSDDHAISDLIKRNSGRKVAWLEKPCSATAIGAVVKSMLGGAS